MKQKQLLRCGSALLLALSLFSLLYVNIDAANGRKAIGHAYSTNTNKKVMSREDERGETPDPAAGATLIGQALNLMHRLVSNLPSRY